MTLLLAAYGLGMVPEPRVEAAIVCSTIANVNSDGKTVFTPLDFLEGRKKHQTAEELEAGRQQRIRDSEDRRRG